MKLIGENLNIMSKKYGKALKEKDPGRCGNSPSSRPRLGWIGSISTSVLRENGGRADVLACFGDP